MAGQGDRLFVTVIVVNAIDRGGMEEIARAFP
jgi:hypothetical protein